MFIWYFLCSQCVYAFVCVCKYDDVAVAVCCRHRHRCLCFCCYTLCSVKSANAAECCWLVPHNNYLSAKLQHFAYFFSSLFVFSDTFFDTVSRYLCLSSWVRVCVRTCVCTLHTFCILFTGVQHFVCSFHYPDEKRSKIQIIETTTTETNITAMQKKVCHPASCVLNVPQQQVAYKIHKIPIVGCCCHSVNMILCIDDSKCLKKVESHKQLITFVWYGGGGL